MNSDNHDHKTKYLPPEKTTWLVDSSIYVYRAWHTWTKNAEDIHGNPINAVHGFLHFVYQLLSTEKPTNIGFAFDEPLKHSHRRELYPAYKAHRKPAPDALRYQFTLCRQFIRALGLSEFSSAYYEADDIIGTLARYYRNKGHRIFFITADKDLAQLIHRYDLWWEYGTNYQMDSWQIQRRFGVQPRQLADLLAIIGDKSDNIPAVPEIGMKTAARLIKQFDNIDNLLSRSPEIAYTKLRRARYIQHLIEEHAATIRIAKQLTQIICDVDHAPFEQNLQWQQQSADRDSLNDLFTQLKIDEREQAKWLRLAGCC
ncbi:MAG TPA: flap endonuclease [Thiothrix sp.]|nr:flap endonuclease [Thiothrix sp.]